EYGRRCAMNLAYFTETFPWLAPIGQFFAATFLILFMAVSVVALENQQWGKQKMALKDWQFNEAYTREVLLKYPHLSEADATEAFEQLRLYFGICGRNEKKLVAMPSKLVDTCWHVFICDTRNYARFCEAVFGRFLHHEPPNGIELQKMPADALNQLQMLANARAYQGALLCGTKQVNVGLTVPLLFSIDERLRIDDGFCYSTEFLESLAAFDLKQAEEKLSKTDGAADGSGAACGDGGSCGCGGSV
ncbi:MAG: hypothetical protein RI918_1383, partial [Pseudomonadota bacterium]